MNDQDGLYSKLSTLVSGKGVGGTGVKFYSSPSSFPGSCFFLPRGRKGEDPGNEVDESRNEEEIMAATDLAGQH